MKLDLWFLVPGPSERTVLLDTQGRLPTIQVEASETEAAVVAVTSFLRDAWELDAPALGGISSRPRATR